MLIFFTSVIFTLLIGNTYCQNPSQKEYENYYNDYDDANTNKKSKTYRGQSNTYQYAQPAKQEYKIPGTIECYSCHYQYKNGDLVGIFNCDTKFNPTEVPKVTCADKCGLVLVNNLKDNGFMITRNCMKNCKNYRNKDGYRQCCSTDLCNGGRASSLTVHFGLLTVATLLLALRSLFA